MDVDLSMSDSGDDAVRKILCAFDLCNCSPCRFPFCPLPNAVRLSFVFLSVFVCLLPCVCLRLFAIFSNHSKTRARARARARQNAKLRKVTTLPRARTRHPWCATARLAARRKRQKRTLLPRRRRACLLPRLLLCYLIALFVGKFWHDYDGFSPQFFLHMILALAALLITEACKVQRACRI